MQAPPYTLTNESITIILNGKSNVVQKGTPHFQALRNAILNENWDEVEEHLTPYESLKKWATGAFTVVGEKFFHNGVELPQDINDRVIEMATQNHDPSAMLNFWTNLQKNPSFRSVQQLWTFLKHKGIPLTDDGCFLAYKSVRSDFFDHHSGKFENRPGTVHNMPRNQISDDPNHACHEGFHVGALEYAQSFGSGDRRIVICKVNPQDVVCVPYDSSAQKMRVCKYEVIGLHNGTHLDSSKYEEDRFDYDDRKVDPFDHTGEDSYEDGYGWDPDNDDVGEDEDVPLATGKVYADNPDKNKVQKRAAKKGFSKLDKMGLEDLLDQPIDALRRYAGKGLQIIGASKIPGGKLSLVTKILEVRK